MTRTVAAPNLAQLEADRSHPVKFIQLGTIRLNDQGHSLMWDGHTWIGGRLSDTGSIQEALETSAPDLDIYIDGTQSDALGRLWATDRTDDDVEIYEGFLNDSGALVSTPMLWWTGFVLGCHLDADTAVQEVRCESVFSRVDRSAEFEFSPESQNRRHSFRFSQTGQVPVVSGGSGSGATLTSIGVNAAGAITGTLWDSGGSGYAEGDVITFTQGTSQTTYTLLAADVTSSGSLRPLAGKNLAPLEDQFFNFARDMENAKISWDDDLSFRVRPPQPAEFRRRIRR